MTALLDTHTAIIGASGAGKTVTAKGHVEQLLNARRHLCVLDPTSAWWGLRSNAAGDEPGFDIPIFGGPRGDVQITADQGEAVGAIVAGGVSAIVDISGLRTGSEQRRFTRDLCRRLRAKPDGNFHLIVDEADEFAAQKPRDDFGFEVGEELIWMAKRGRLAGFVLTLITQRPASIDKEVLTQAQTLIVHQLISPVDQKPVVDYLKDHAERSALAAIKASLASLARGERWVYSPRLGVLERGISPMPTTFDSSRTPAPGERIAEPRMLASIDLAEIRAALDPDHSNRESTCTSFPQASEEADRKFAELIRANAECADIITEQMDEIASLKGQAEEAYMRGKVAGIAIGISRAGAAIDALRIKEINESQAKTGNEAEGVQISEPSGEPVSRPAAGRLAAATSEKMDVTAGETAPLNASARKMLEMLQRIAPARATWIILAGMVGNKATGGNFHAARKAMRESGLIVEVGNTVRAVGANAAGLTRPEAIALWTTCLQNPAPRMIMALDGAPLARDALGDAIGIQPRGGHFNHGVAQLLRNGVAIERSGVLHLADPLPGQSA